MVKSTYLSKLYNEFLIFYYMSSNLNKLFNKRYAQRKYMNFLEFSQTHLNINFSY